MKNQYVGDIGDYGKLGLLRQLKGFKLGVNWYLTAADGKKDGLHIDYLTHTKNVEDQTLHSALKKLVCTDNRSVIALEKGILPDDTVFYHDEMNFSNINRKEWHKNALKKLNDCNLVFLDPDNGLEISKQDSKHVNYSEIADYFMSGASVIIYSHRDRSKEDEYIARLTRVSDEIKVADDKKPILVCLKFTKVSVRDFLFVIQPKQYEAIEACIKNIEKLWKGSFERRKLPANI